MVITYFAVGDLSLSTVTDDLNELNDHIQKLIDLGVAGTRYSAGKIQSDRATQCAVQK